MVFLSVRQIIVTFQITLKQYTSKAMSCHAGLKALFMLNQVFLRLLFHKTQESNVNEWG
jgi:hypothetical protein